MIVYRNTLHWSHILLTRVLVTKLGLISDFDNNPIPEGFIEQMGRVQLANKGQLLLHVSGTVQFVILIASNVETSLSWTCRVSGLWISNIPRYFYFAPYFLCIYIHPISYKIQKNTSAKIDTPFHNQIELRRWTICSFLVLTRH